MKKNRALYFAWIGMLVVSAMACGLGIDLPESLGEGVGTAQALATQAAESGIAATIQAAVTQGLSSAQATISAFATEHSDEWVATAKAVATQVSETDFRATLSALATEKGPEAQATLQALGTMVASEPPDDLPIVQGDVQELFSTGNSLTYSTALERSQVADFYKLQMPAYGWKIVLMGSIETEQGTFLRFEKDGRSASVGITTNPLNQKTVVSILVENK